MVLNFVCRASKARKNGLSPIELSIIIKGERKIIAIQRYCKADDFNSKTQKVRGDKELNAYLESVKKKCWKIEMDLMQTGVEFSVDDFVNTYKYGKQSKTILDVYDEHNKMYMSKVLSGEIDNGTLYKYKKSKEKVEKFLSSTGRSSDIKSITPSFVEDYMSWLSMDMKSSTVNKEMKMLKKMFAYAVREGYITANPFHITLKEEKLTYHPLTEQQINKIWSMEIDNERLSSIRDMFIFQCYTGLAYCDLVSLTKDDIVDDVIIKSRKKTEIDSVIPLLPVSKAILEKYEYRLPVISNQKYNVLLKALGDLCGIKVNLTSHLGRHSFGTLLLNKGCDMKTVSRAMGHSNSRITEKVYAEMRNQTVVDNIRKVM